MQCLPKRVARRHLRHSCTGGLKAEFNSCFTPSGLATNDAEPLFLALVLLDSGASARDAQEWAKMVHPHSSRLASIITPPQLMSKARFVFRSS